MTRCERNTKPTALNNVLAAKKVSQRNAQYTRYAHGELIVRPRTAGRRATMAAVAAKDFMAEE